MGKGKLAIQAQAAVEATREVRAGLVVSADGIILSLNPQSEDLFGYTAAERVGHGLNTLLLELPRIESSRLRAGAPGAATEVDTLFFGRHRNGRLFPLLCENHPSGHNTILTLRLTVSAVSEDSTPLHHNPVAHNKLLKVLNRLLQISLANVSHGQLLSYALDQVLALPELDCGGHGAIYLLDTHGQLNIPATHWFPRCAPSERNQVMQIANCLRGHAGSAQKTAIVSNTRHLPGLPDAGDSQYIGVPILQDEQLLGIFTLMVPIKHRWLESGTLWVIADTLATLIMRIRTETENLHLLEENRRLSQRLIGILEEERRKIARELHDDVGQSLTAIKTDAALILNHSDPVASLIGQSARAIAATADHLYAVTHNLLRQLRPGALDDLGLVAALRSHLNDWSARRPGTACEFRMHGEFDNLGENINIALYRVMQEALNNIIRHAAATRVEIVLHRDNAPDGADEVCLQVSDNGRGVDLENIPAKQRHGLVGIRERIEALRGRLTLASHRDQGFCLLARLPVNTEPEGC